MSAEPAHPAPEADVVLRDGATARVRPVRAGDAGAIRALYAGLSRRSTWLRFFSLAPDVDWVVRWATDLDGGAGRQPRRAGLVAVTGGELVAHAGYECEAGDPTRAEVGMAIADRLQGHGLGTILLGQLAEAADAAGVHVFTADVLAENYKMIQVFRDSGFAVRTRTEPGTIRVEFPTSMSTAARDRFESRERSAATAAMRALLAPRSIAVIGASRRRGTVGAELFHNLLAGGFQGPVHPVNLGAEVVQSVLAVPSVLDVAGPVDLAVIAVPCARVLEVAGQCAAKGVRGLVVVSAGFAETGPAGAARQGELLRLCRRTGMRLVGPNCLGVVNTDPAVSMDATFGPKLPAPGRVGLLSQSGALGLAVIDHAGERGLGLSSFVSIGNRADISTNDLLDYWEHDDGTDLVLLYLESFGNPRRFARTARRVARTKPIVAVKSGRSSAGARATSSHTGALLAASDVTVDALFRQAGVIRADTLGDMFDVAALLAHQPLPAGPRVGIVTNVGGPGILCADACEAGGLRVPRLSDTLQARLAAFMPPESGRANPVDLLAAASPAAFERAISLLRTSGEVDAVISIFLPTIGDNAAAVAAAVARASAPEGGPVPALTVLMATGAAGPAPVYTFPEDAARALALAAAHAAWLARPAGTVPELAGLRHDEAAALLATALAGGRDPCWLTPLEVQRLLDCYGVAMAEGAVAASPAEAGALAETLGGPVAVKAVAPTLVHKTEAQGVQLGLSGSASVREAAEAMTAALAAAGHKVDGFLVQRMVGGGVELLVGVVNDAVFGPVMACGAGGTAVELLKDVAVRITPLTDSDAAEMVHDLATYPLLDGYRGAPRADVAALEQVLLRLSALVEDHPDVAELDCNPVAVLRRGGGAVVLDARVRLERHAPPPPVAARVPE
jgi:acyl-CoA synthetase (NDP forming)/RimJ/RimL family protein N-acetyltransferase